jgi:small subunit ribosomal protein S34
MPIKYVGIPIEYKGKTLFEILSNLKNFGVGRILVRSRYERYPEPTYYRITRVEPQMDEYNRYGKAWSEQIFRGRNMGEQEVPSVYVSDWRLLHKHEEDAYCKRPFTPLPEVILPRYTNFPPLLSYMIKTQRAALGLPTDKTPQLEMDYILQPQARGRLAKEGETPTGTVTEPENLYLYQSINKSRTPTANKDKKPGSFF